MSNEIIKDSGEYYRSYDKANDRWTRHYFWGLAKLTLLSSGETVQHAIDNVSSKVLSIIAQTDSSSTTTAPSSKLFHDTITSMRSNFQAGCSAIAAAIRGGRDGNGTNGVATSNSDTPTQMATKIKTLASNCYNAGYAFGINDTSATSSDLFKAGRDWADNRVNTASKSYTDGYSKGKTDGVASVKTAHKLTVPSARNNNAAVTGNWYTSVDNTACYDTGYNAGKKYANENVDTTSASYKKGQTDYAAKMPTTLTFTFNSGADANDGGIMRRITNLQTYAQFYIPPGYTKIKGSGRVSYGSASLNLTSSYQTCKDAVIAQIWQGSGSGSLGFSVTISK